MLVVIESLRHSISDEAAKLVSPSRKSPLVPSVGLARFMRLWQELLVLVQIVDQLFLQSVWVDLEVPWPYFDSFKLIEHLIVSSSFGSLLLSLVLSDCDSEITSLFRVKRDEHRVKRLVRDVLPICRLLDFLLHSYRVVGLSVLVH